MARRPPHATLVMTTTALVQGRPVAEYLGVVAAQTIVGANVVREIMAGFRDFLGGRSSSYERVLQKARAQALQMMEDEAAGLGADAVIGIDLDFQTVGPHGSLIMVSASGTAVRFGDDGTGPLSVARRV
jgi:uncharacterized protein YbjQ (UPF0145 family)